MSAGPVRLVVIGAGAMGTKHVRAASGLAEVQVVAVVDPHESKRAALATGIGAAQAVSIDALLGDESLAGRIDAAIVATPTMTHHAVATACLTAGLHVLVEKPFAACVGQAEDLVRRSTAAGVVLTVGHIERFNPALRALVRRVERPVHLELVRFGPMRAQIVDDVVADLMIHDLDLALILAGGAVVAVSGVAEGAHGSEHETVIARLTFANGITASLTAGRRQHRQRRVSVTQPGSTVTADLIEQRVTIDRTARHGAWRHIDAPAIESTRHDGDPLRDELRAFAAAIRGGPVVMPGPDGVDALMLAERVRQACG